MLDPVVTGTLVDLSHVIDHGMTTYPGLPGPEVTDHLSREASRDHYAPGTEFHIGRIDMVASTGTYLDAPAHRYPDGFDLAGLPLVSVADLRGILVTATDQAIGPDAVAGLDLAGAAVLFSTGWDGNWRTDRYGAGEHPYLTADTAAALVAGRAALVGTDSVNIGHGGETEALIREPVEPGKMFDDGDLGGDERSERAVHHRALGGDRARHAGAHRGGPRRRRAGPREAASPHGEDRAATPAPDSPSSTPQAQDLSSGSCSNTSCNTARLRAVNGWSGMTSSQTRVARSRSWMSSIPASVRMSSTSGARAACAFIVNKRAGEAARTTRPGASKTTRPASSPGGTYALACSFSHDRGRSWRRATSWAAAITAP